MQCCSEHATDWKQKKQQLQKFPNGCTSFREYFKVFPQPHPEARSTLLPCIYLSGLMNQVGLVNILLMQCSLELKNTHVESCMWSYPTQQKTDCFTVLINEEKRPAFCLSHHLACFQSATYVHISIWKDPPNWGMWCWSPEYPTRGVYVSSHECRGLYHVVLKEDSLCGNTGPHYKW